MPPGGVRKRLQAARSEVDRVCGMLVWAAPDEWNRTTTVLESAVTELAEARRRAAEAPTDPDALVEAWKLRKSLRRAGGLLESAAQLQNGWQRTFGTLAGGYTSSGEPGQPLYQHRLCVQA